MPMQWTQPLEAVTAGKRQIFHTYKSGDIEQPHPYVFTTDVMERCDFEFDVRSLPIPQGVTADNYSLIIESAIDEGLIPLIDEAYEQEESPGVTATIVSDDFFMQATFDVAAWFDQAPIESVLEIFKAGFANNHIVESIAEWSRDKNYRVAAVFHHLGEKSLAADYCGYQFQIEETEALSYLKRSHPDTYGAVLINLGLAIKVSGFVDETLIVRKCVDLVFELDEDHQRQYFESVDGVPTLIEGAVSADLELQDNLEGLLKEEAYRESGISSWEPVETEDIKVYII